MRQRIVALSLLFLAGLIIPYSGLAERRDRGFAPPDHFQVRAETHLKCRLSSFDYSSGGLSKCFDEQTDPTFKFDLDDQSIKLDGGSRGFIDVPRMASRFVASSDSTVAAITFSAMHFPTTIKDEPFLIRALIDGVEAKPGPIVFTAGFSQTQFGAQSFTFFATVNSGLHIVQIQWSSESSTKAVYLRNASLLVSVDSQNNASQRVVMKASDLKSPLYKGDSSWTAITDAELSFNMPESGEAALTLSSVLKMEAGDFIQVRAIIDNGGAAAIPVENLLAARAYHFGARSLTFTADGLKAGTHKVQFEWRSSATDVTASATLQAWTVCAVTGPRETKDSYLDVITQTGQATSSSPDFERVPTLETDVPIEEVSDVAVTFSAAFSGPGVVVATVMNDGVPMQEQETLVYAPAIKTDEKGNKYVTEAGGQSYTFALKDLPAGNPSHKIGIAYRVVEAGVATSPSATVYNATMTVMSKRRIGPDLAVGANMGAGSRKREALIEPARGNRKILAIIFDPGRPDAPAADRDFRAGIERILFGPVPSVSDYYRVVSGERLTLEEVAVLGPYVGDKAGGETGENHYWDTAAHDPNGDGNCDDSVDNYCTNWQEQQSEPVEKANAEIDFSQYDLDRNGAVSASELGIIVITPQNTATGSETKLKFFPFVDRQQPLICDGVIIESLFHWYTPGIGDGTDPTVEMNSAMTASHEMAHLLLRLDDVYGRQSGVFGDSDYAACSGSGDPNCQTRYMNTSPHPTSMMTHYTVDSTPHLDGFHKLQLGWVTPRIVQEHKDFSLTDVKTGGEIIILPRRNTDAREYALLETRFESGAIDDPLYDFGILDSGLAVYHIIEPGPSCKAADGATAQNCPTVIKPMCVTSDAQWDLYASNFVRPGLRLIQPDITHLYTGSGTTFGDTLFGNANKLGQDLLDSVEGGPVCPIHVGDAPPAGAQPLLLWADGTASGYRLKTIKFDYSVPSVPAVTFTVE